MAYARRWQIELAWKSCKSELGMQSPRVWGWQTRLKLLGLATLAYAFLLHLLSAPFQLVRRWLLRYAAQRSGRRWRDTGATGPFAPGAEPLVAGLSTSLESTCQTSAFRELTAVRFCGRVAVPCDERVHAGWESADSCTCCITGRKRYNTEQECFPPRRRQEHLLLAHMGQLVLMAFPTLQILLQGRASH